MRLCCIFLFLEKMRKQNEFLSVVMESETFASGIVLAGLINVNYPGKNDKIKWGLFWKTL